MRRDWNDRENMAICLAYCIMLAAQQRGDKFNKSAIRRELIGTDAEPCPLHARSNGSVEAKFMNCSAAAQAINLPTVKGYKPAPNYQKALQWHMSQAWSMVQSDIDHGIETDISVAVA